MLLLEYLNLNLVFFSALVAHKRCCHAVPVGRIQRVRVAHSLLSLSDIMSNIMPRFTRRFSQS